MMFQEAALYPHLRVGDNIGFPLKMAGVRTSTIRGEVASIASTLGIRPLLSRRPAQLSGGQRQRVAMARSLIRRPELLLMDEPMSNLDAKLRGELRATIGHLQHELRITTLYVTHDQVEAMSLGDRIAVMRGGRIVQLDTPSNLYLEPVDAFVATFIGAPSMNLFLGRLRLGPSGPTVDVGSVRVPLRSARWPDMTAWGGHDVVVGVRPHDFRFVDDGAVVDVEQITTVGDRRLVVARLGAPRVWVTETGLTLGSGPTAITVDVGPGEPVGEDAWRASHVAVDADDIHLFDPQTGKTLRPESRSAANSRQVACVTT
jgi:multiple sugar transport system ATP-binding protein